MPFFVIFVVFFNFNSYVASVLICYLLQLLRDYGLLSIQTKGNLRRAKGTGVSSKLEKNLRMWFPLCIEEFGFFLFLVAFISFILSKLEKN